jgi:hypothetical protein
LRSRIEPEAAYGSPRTLRRDFDPAPALLLFVFERLLARGCELVYVLIVCADNAGVPGRAAPRDLEFPTLVEGKDDDTLELPPPRKAFSFILEL